MSQSGDFSGEWLRCLISIRLHMMTSGETCIYTTRLSLTIMINPKILQINVTNLRFGLYIFLNGTFDLFSIFCHFNLWEGLKFCSSFCGRSVWNHRLLTSSCSFSRGYRRSGCDLAKGWISDGPWTSHVFLPKATGWFRRPLTLLTLQTINLKVKNNYFKLINC